jgi:two-component system chemotaxis sensor kinase CheA
MENHKKDIQNIDNILQNIDSTTSNLQAKVMQTRMQPISNIFDKFPRIVRDLSKSLNKEINLELEGRNVELDKSIIEALSDPLIHLVRNSADHGLESKEERELKGKSRIGNIKLKAYYRAGYVIIDVIDDGKGIDINIVKRTALEKGLVCDYDILQMSEKEIIELIFNPGFSTTDNVTNISGRGVGMDIVKTNIKKLGGNIEIYTKRGKETTVRLSIPLTLAIISALIIESRNQKFAIPQINIKKIVRITPKDTTKRIEYLNNIKVLRFREKILPIVILSEVLGCSCSDYKKVNYKKIIRILILKVGFKEFALMVDKILDDEEVLVKSLPRYIKDCQCYSGVTILGDGRVAAILDINGIAEKAKIKLNNKINLKKLKTVEEVKYIDEKRNLLLFKCSKHETFALDLSSIRRVEEIASDKIELIGDKEYIKYRGNSLRIIRPSNYMPVSECEKDAKKYYVIIPKFRKYPVGILIDKICDTLETSIKLNNDAINFKGILGTIMLNNKIILLLNINELFEMALPEKYSISCTNITEKKEFF